MKRVLTAMVLIPLVLLVLFKAPMWLFTLVVGVVAMGAAVEYFGLVEAHGLHPMKGMALVFIAFLFVATAFGSVWLIYPAVLLFFLPLLLLIMSVRSEDLAKALPSAASTAFVVPYIALALWGLVLLRQNNSGLFLIVFTFVIVWSGDIFAYYAGRAFGRHKLAARISPGKTWEGTAASFLGSVFLAHVLFVDNHQIMVALHRWGLTQQSYGLPEMSRSALLVTGMTLGACVNVAAQIGDLAESLIKRGAGVKDSGRLLPGHGGVLDRIDALLFAIPVVCLYFLTASLESFP